jgi:two-component system, LytTR family, response regulator
MRVLVVDDEPLARAALEKILAANPAVERFDSANDAVEAQQRLANENYDVVLLDIRMPELSGLDLVARLEQYQRPLPSVVFVTAHAEHALAAFEKHAVDFVLKPFSSDRVNRAIEFASRRTASERTARLVELMPQLQAQRPEQPSKIGIKSNGRILVVDLRDIVAVQAEGKYVLLHREGGSDLLRESITNVAEKLKPHGFVRIHRSALVNASFVREIRSCPTGEYLLRLKDGKEYTVTRTYRASLKSLARFWIGSGSFLSD